MLAQFLSLVRSTVVVLVVASALGGLGMRVASGAEDANRPYAIVVEKKTLDDPGWKGVVEALQKKHSAKIFHQDGGDAKLLRENLAKFRPYYVCFVAPPDQLARQGKAQVKTKDGRSLELPLCGLYYRNVGMLMCSLDDDPYDDAIWAVLTGATADDALRVVSAKPLVVRKGLSHVGSGWLEWLDAGVSFNESKQGQKWIKMPGKPREEVQGPDDTTEQFVAALNTGNVDMVSSSGHATEHDWQMGYSYRNGQIIIPSRLEKLPQAARDNYKKLLDAKPSGKDRLVGRLLGVDTSNNVYEILANNPKVYYSPGNCLIANVNGKDCMALSWIHHGAMQFFGHTGMQTRSCYAWGVAEYFLRLQGRFSYAESVWLNQQALRLEVSQLSGDDKKRKYICCRNMTCLPAHGRFLWETTVLYGDPAWEARVKPATEPLYDQEVHTKDLADGRVELTFTAKIRSASLPSRPAAFWLDGAVVSEVEVKEGPENLIIADNFALVPFWKSGQPAPELGKQYKAVVIAKRVPAGK